MHCKSRQDIEVPVRVYQLYVSYMAGASLRTVGAEVNISGERVRQLFTKYELPRRAKEAQSRASLKFLHIARQADSLNDASRRSGLEPETLRHRLKKMGRYPALRRLWRMRQRHIVRRHFSDLELLNILRKLARDLGRAPVQRDLDTVETVPSHKTYVERFGSLRAARFLAGIPDVNRCARPMKLSVDLSPLPTLHFTKQNTEKAKQYVSSGSRRRDPSRFERAASDKRRVAAS